MHPELTDDRLSASRERCRSLLRLAQAGIAFAFCVIALSFWSFQVGQYVRFAEMAENNHQRVLDLRALRGAVVDRNGDVLVQNRYSLDICLIREQVTDLERTLGLVAAATGTDLQALRDAVAGSADVPVYRPLVLIKDATQAQVAAVAVRAFELPEVFVERNPTRHYPSGTVASHLFGYVGEVTGSQLRAATDERIKVGAVIGQSGVEQAYNRLLMGEDGTRRVAVDSIGRELGTLEELPPAEGQPLQLTIDFDVQKAAEDAFARAGFTGAAVALDPRSGEVLALASLPAYDPNDFARGIDGPTWSMLNNDARRPLQNRALQGRYSPGSTFKLVVAVAALQEGIATPDFTVDCQGGGVFYGRFFRCHSRHGTVAMDQALEKSCNTYFYTLGQRAGIDAIHRWATALGLGRPTGIDLPHEVTGTVPSREWKRQRLGERWYPGETISVAIGQGSVAVTPLSLAVMMATVANGGTRVTPHLLKAVNEGQGFMRVPRPVPRSRARISRSTLDVVTEGLWFVVNRAGTGRRGRIVGRNVIGKTGTAQVISLRGRAAARASGRDFRDHGWFVFAAPVGAPEIAGAVFGEHNDHGYLSAPIAKRVLETYFAKQEGQQRPMLPVPPAPGTASAAAADQ
jgi:penicillin-binding protein 2